MPAFLHLHTPSLSVIDPRGSPVRGIAYHRVNEGDEITARVNRQVFNANAHLTRQWDPRLWALAVIDDSAVPNQKTLFDLSGRPLGSDSVDAGWRVVFNDAGGQLQDSWDARGLHLRRQYDELLRPEAVFAQLTDGTPEHCVERFAYGGVGAQEARRNRCGQLIRHDDPAGTLWHEAFAVTSQPLTEKRRFCAALSQPDWPLDEAGREDLLESRTYTTLWQHDALGGVVAQTDAVGGVQRFELDIAGQGCASYLNGVALLKSAHYNAYGQVEVERSGNGVMVTASYSAAGGELYHLHTRTAAGHLLQDLRYEYDPVGNIERIEDMSQPVQWFAQQRIEAVNLYAYDTLYQLTSASGRENASQILGPDLPGLHIFGPKDDSRWRNFTQAFSYDTGGNLILLRHEAGAGHSYNREMAVAERSNRSLQKDGSPIDFARGFDRNGNQLALSPGQAMQWDSRNQLSQVTQVRREDPDGRDDDVEVYVYDGGGMRVRKVRRAKTRGGAQVSEVRYLPGLEIRTRTFGEELHVAIAQAGRNGVQYLHWENRLPKGLDNNQIRYSLSDHLGSSSLELDGAAQVISQESYYPFGGTAWWAARSSVEAQYKTVRYSGQERDATGLYYYGFRYYAPWLQRWINPDPSGDADGLNVYCMVGNSPVSLFDANGHERQEAVARWQGAFNKIKQANSPVSVRTVATGIISVNISGGNDLFARMGMSFSREVEGDRKLSYLSIDSSYKSKISGGDEPVFLKGNPVGSVNADKKLQQSSTTAFINGGFYNLKQRADSKRPTYASVGENTIDGQKKAYTPIPMVYRGDYAKVEMADKSMIYSGPVLSRGGSTAFTSGDLKKGRFMFSKDTDSVGSFGHANQPNPRSGISFADPKNSSARTRLAVGLADSRKSHSPGYVMDEWASVMARLERLNPGAQGWSVNLDGGGSSTLGVVSKEHGILMVETASSDSSRDIGNFIAFYKPKTSRLRSAFSKLTGR